MTCRGGEGIRTPDPCRAKAVLYRTELHPRNRARVTEGPAWTVQPSDGGGDGGTADGGSGGAGSGTKTRGPTIRSASRSLPRLELGTPERVEVHPKVLFGGTRDLAQFRSLLSVCR